MYCICMSPPKNPMKIFRQADRVDSLGTIKKEIEKKKKTGHWSTRGTINQPGNELCSLFFLFWVRRGQSAHLLQYLIYFLCRVQGEGGREKDLQNCWQRKTTVVESRFFIPKICETKVKKISQSLRKRSKKGDRTNKIKKR